MGNFVERLRGLLAKATPGPWTFGSSPNRPSQYAALSGLTHGEPGHIATVGNGEDDEDVWPNRANVQLIAFLRNHAEALAEVVEAARKRNSVAYDPRVTSRELDAALRKLEESNDVLP